MDLSIFELHNHWLPLIWTIAGGILFDALPKTTVRIGDRMEKRWHWFSAVLLVLPLIVWAGVRTSVGDTYAYMRKFQEVPASLPALSGYLAANSKDRGFSVFIGLLKALGISNVSTFFLIVAAIQMLCMAKTFRKYSDNSWICIFLFVASSDYISWMFNGLRQFLAATITFGAFDLMVRKKHVQFCLVVLLASTIHGSALLMLPLAYIMHGPALNRKTMLMILGVVVIVPFIDRFLPILDVLLEDTQYSGITGDEIWTVDDGTNIIRVLVYSVPALLALFGRRYVVRVNNPVMNLCVNGAMITMAIYLVSSVTSGIYIGRLPIYTTLHGYMALPWLIGQIFEKDTAKLIKLLMTVCYIGFYYYQMGLMWGML